MGFHLEAREAVTGNLTVDLKQDHPRVSYELIGGFIEEGLRIFHVMSFQVIKPGICLVLRQLLEYTMSI